MDGTLTGTTNSGQSRPESNGNDKVLHIPQSFGCSSVSKDTPREEFISLQGAVSVFYSPIQQGLFVKVFCIQIKISSISI